MTWNYSKYIFIYHWDREECLAGKKVQVQCGAHSKLHNSGDTIACIVGHLRSYLICRNGFWLYDLTGKSFSVSPFSASYNMMQDVKNTTFLTEYTDEYVRTWILVFNDVLWFGRSMDHSIINPNQIRITVMPVSDYPFDKNRKIGIAH